MSQDNTSRQSEQSIDVPLKVGSRVALIEDASVEVKDGEVQGGTSQMFFEDWVDQYVPQTGLLQFEDCEVGRAEFLEMMDDADGILIMNEEEHKQV